MIVLNYDLMTIIIAYVMDMDMDVIMNVIMIIIIVVSTVIVGGDVILLISKTW